MDFTYDDYRNLLMLLKKHGYEVANYNNWESKKRCVILRHDIDNSIECAIELAKLEYKCEVSSIYFVLVSSNFYNVFSKKNRQLLFEIQEMGHEIGLHFDETVYMESAEDIASIQEKILQESGLLQIVTGAPVTNVSMHRPSREIIEADLQIPGMINTYSNTFFKQFKYLSDSRCCWREPVWEIIESERYENLHILTHAFWYHSINQDAKRTIAKFVEEGSTARLLEMKNNFTSLNRIYDGKM